MSVIGLIPARERSTRLPNKLLLDQTGKPLLQYTWEAACSANKLDRVIVATDSRKIADVVTRFGGEVAITGEHPSGTDRIAEVVRNLGSEVSIAVNIQGDEPDIDPNQINSLVETLEQAPGVQMSTLGTPIREMSVLKDPSCTKVVCDEQGRALYFSRSMIPFCRDHNPEELLDDESPWLLHLGLYAYRRDFLLQLTELPPSRLEKLEKLEQLRALETGARIQVAVVEHRSVGIDTPEDYAQFVTRKIRRAA
ncbi:3-deoxy-manno-octulosonate cytidylyltransferase [Polystyrenella longa]|uniref:3-deoxy-manno-octulosonate cytidylyltransferase n=1 Tax=Polystyrenella longa TaxID=2528007 RepID=A0A518CPS7_9PLAN|nr:3-deoxy-manno-octulosonate cytidylyltransferase [Polystyrenella longa]QDU81231.1 3-deoxy-manno-octulosonate cytidylyltransferase [Polystyrenella longa]